MAKITFPPFANIPLWVIDTFMSHREITQVVLVQKTGSRGIKAQEDS
jgi:hypothetical protein